MNAIKNTYYEYQTAGNPLCLTLLSLIWGTKKG